MKSNLNLESIMKFSVPLLALLLSVPFAKASANQCVDTGVVGDGWGWDGTQSCRIDINITAGGECIDADGDGWGWDGVGSCRVNAEQTSSNDAVFQVAPTGQTTTYLTGDDGDLETTGFDASRFTDNANGTFDDNLTGLTWLSVRQCIFDQTWSSAINYASQLSADGSLCLDLNDGSAIGDWRLPNINELQSLVDYGKHNPVFAAGIPFTGTWDTFPWGRYWSSTSFVAEGINAWVLNSDFGQIGIHNKANVARAFAVKD